MKYTLVRLCPATTAWWDLHDPVLKVGDLGVATDTGVGKLGDGHTKWSDLPAMGEVGPAGADGADGATLPPPENVPMTTPSLQDVIDALVALGLVTQADLP